MNKKRTATLLITLCAVFSSCSNSGNSGHSVTPYVPKTRPSIPENYQRTTPTGGDIEEQYLQNGDYEVDVLTYQAESPMNKYTYYFREPTRQLNNRASGLYIGE